MNRRTFLARVSSALAVVPFMQQWALDVPQIGVHVPFVDDALVIGSYEVVALMFDGKEIPIGSTATRFSESDTSVSWTPKDGAVSYRISKRVKAPA